MRQASLLLVENEVVIRMMVADMLGELGHRVVAEAGRVQDALALAQTTNCDLALLDVNLARQNTAPVAEILLARCPDCRVGVDVCAQTFGPFSNGDC